MYLLGLKIKVCNLISVYYRRFILRDSVGKERLLSFHSPPSFKGGILFYIRNHVLLDFEHLMLSIDVST